MRVISVSHGRQCFDLHDAEKAGSRCGSSSGTNTASMAILKSLLTAAVLLGKHDAAEPSSAREDKESKYSPLNKCSPSPRSAEIQLEASLNFETNNMKILGK